MHKVIAASALDNGARLVFNGNKIWFIPPNKVVGACDEAPAEAPAKKTFGTKARELLQELAAMDEEEWLELRKNLLGSAAEDEGEPQDLEHIKLGLKPFPGKRGTQAAMDAAESFASRYPEVARVKPSPSSAVSPRE